MGLWLAAALLALPAPGQQEAFHWPNGAKAAVALTYDDGIALADLDHAIPDLDAAGLRGTFYVPAESRALGQRMEEWRAAAARGHELGNHSLVHPCIMDTPKEHRAFVIPERDLATYTVRRMVDEVSFMNTLLTAIDGQRARTFAYPCGDVTAGGVSYIDGLRPLFAGARALGGTTLADVRSVDLYRVPSWGLSGVSAEKMTAWVEQAVAKGGFAVFTFHGVGGGHSINVERAEHQKLLAWLAANKDRIWTVPFVNLVQHIASERERLGWK